MAIMVVAVMVCGYHGIGPVVIIIINISYYYRLTVKHTQHTTVICTVHHWTLVD